MELELLNKICSLYGLGTPVCQPVTLKGGYMHKMYSLFTEKGEYAVKLLNPYVMQRPDAMENYRTAEALEKKLEDNGIPILPAKVFGGRKMQETDGRYFYLFDRYGGRALKSREIKDLHCEKIGSLLAGIHKIDRRETVCEYDEMSIDWDNYISLLESKNRELYQLLRENRTLLYESQDLRNAAVGKLPSVRSVCHNDMDSKNVLWKGSDCRIIDLECLSYSSPDMECYELALCWSGYEDCKIDFDKLDSFVNSYIKAGGIVQAAPEVLYSSNHGRLEWLEYNVKRSLGTECSEEEIEMGCTEVKDTVAHVIYYHEAKEDILYSLKQLL